MSEETASGEREATTGDRIAIRSRKVAVDEEEARERIRNPPTPGIRIKHWLAGVDVQAIDLSYKPFYAFDAVLTNEGRLGSDDDKEGSVVVDAVTGIPRARPEGYAAVEEVSVRPEAIVATELDEGEARDAAREFRVKLEHRESREAELGETAEKLYKPVWVAALDTGDRCVVDAVNSEVFSDVSLWQALPFRS